MIELSLKKIGLTEKDIRVYLALLKLGSAPVRKIAGEVGLNHTTVHDCLGKLTGEGLVSFVDKIKHRYFTAEPPERLLTAVRTKRDQLDQLRDDIQKIIPELKSLYEKSVSKPKAKYFEGDVGLRAILQDVLETVSHNHDKRYYAYSSSTIRDALHRVFPNYNEERKQAGVSVRVISIGPGGELHGLDERKWLSREEGAPTYTLIYSGKIALVSLNDKKEPLGVVLEDKNTYQTQVMIFNALWEKLR